MWCLVSQPNAVVIEVRLDHKAKGLECLEKVNNACLLVPRPNSSYSPCRGRRSTVFRRPPFRCTIVLIDLIVFGFLPLRSVVVVFFNNPVKSVSHCPLGSIYRFNCRSINHNNIFIALVINARFK